VGEITDDNGIAPNLGAELADFLMGPSEKSLEHAELVHDFECGRMDGIAAEIAQEVSVFFEDLNMDAGASEKKAQHHSGGAAAGDCALRLDGGLHLLRLCRVARFHDARGQI
jgi:hypothetical protein